MKILLLALAFGTLLAAGCNTIHGMGRDIERGGEATQDAADAGQRSKKSGAGLSPLSLSTFGRTVAVRRDPSRTGYAVPVSVCAGCGHWTGGPRNRPSPGAVSARAMGFREFRSGVVEAHRAGRVGGGSEHSSYPPDRTRLEERRRLCPDRRLGDRGAPRCDRIPSRLFRPQRSAGCARLRRLRVSHDRPRLRCPWRAAHRAGEGAPADLIGFHHVYFDRSDLPDVRAFAAFEFPTIGHVYDVHGAPLTELAREHRQITEYKGIPPIVRDAILAAEDKNFFSHSGVDYSGIPRVLWKVRLRTLLARLVGLSRSDGVDDPIIFPQGGSTITQQLVRGHFLNALTAEENSSQLRHGGLLPRILSFAIGARNVNMAFRKLEEIRLSLWLEAEMRERLGSKRRAKEEIFARYASFIYMGRGQYGFARAAEYYFGRPLGAFTADDADKAALLAGIAKSPLVDAPSAPRPDQVLQRINQTLTLMAANGFISRPAASEAVRRPIRTVARNNDKLQTAAVGESVLQEIKDRHLDVGL